MHLKNVVAFGVIWILVYLSGNNSVTDMTGLDSVSINFFKSHEILAFYCLIITLVTGASKKLSMDF